MFLLVLLLVSAAQEPEVRARGWDDFPVLVWRQRYRGKEVPRELLAPFGGINVERDDEAQWARELGLSYYVGHGPGRDDLHLDSDDEWQGLFQRWYDSRDESLLVRAPCLTDPATLRRMEETLDKTLAARGGDHGLGISLGDEVGLTPYGNPFDLCRSETCEARWRDYAEAHDWPVESPTTDEVRLALGEDDFSLLGPWLARRRFHQDVVIQTLRALAERVRAKSPGTPVGLLGLGGQTAFGGVSVPRAAEFLDFLECYPVSESVELLHTGGKTRSLGTVFLNEDTPEGTAWQTWNHWMQGSDGLVVWSDQELEESPDHRQRLTKAVEDIRSIEQRFPDRSHLEPHTFAVVHDADSIAASWLKDALLDGATWPRRLAGYQEKNGTRERSVDRWLRELRAAGFNPGSIRLQDFDGVASERFTVLILPRILVIDEEELTSLQWHLDRGRTLVIDGELGWVDRQGRPWKKDLVSKLSGRVIVTSGSNDCDVGGISKKAGVHPPFTGVRFDASVPARRSIHYLPDGRRLVVALPDLPTPAERLSKLKPLRAHVEHADDITWIHPPQAPEIPAGEPAIFLDRTYD